MARLALLEEKGLGIKDEGPELGCRLDEALLEPTRIYTEAVLGLLSEHFESVHGLAHITGGGLVENVPRVLPEGLEPEFDFTAWTEPAIFELIRSAGVPEDEMRRTFNLGIGFVCVVASDASAAALEAATLGKIGRYRTSEGRFMRKIVVLLSGTGMAEGVLDASNDGRRSYSRARCLQPTTCRRIRKGDSSRRSLGLC